MNVLPFRLDPDTLHRTFPNDDVVRERIAELTAVLAPLRARDAVAPPDEFEFRLELVMLHLGRGSDVRAAGENAVAELRCGLLPARKKVERVHKKRARHLARLAGAVCWQWQGQFVHSTLLYLELDAVGDEHERDLQALTCLLAATNDADQQLWVDAADHFERALLLAGCGEQLPDLVAAAAAGLAVARRRSYEDAA